MLSACCCFRGILKYYWKFRFGRNARFLYLQKSGGLRSRFSAIWQSGEFGKILCSVKFASPQDRSIFAHAFLMRLAGKAPFNFFGNLT
jgi:hypothetical protein